MRHQPAYPCNRWFCTRCRHELITEQEADGVRFYDEQGKATDCFALLQKLGMNAVRLRVWVNHSTGWCNQADVLAKARRAHALKQRIMIDFHYSDFFCDPGRQTVPAAWTHLDLAGLSEAVAEHTTAVLSALQAEGIVPEWVQVGNETTNGMLWDYGRLWNETGDMPDGWRNYARLSNAGYDAVKRICPDTKVIVHIDNAYDLRDWYWNSFRQAGGKFDMIGLSHYPQTNADKSWKTMNTLCANNISTLSERFGVEVMISEIGTKSDNPTLAAQVMQDFVNKVSETDSACAGIFYWEPQVYNGWKPQEYNALGWGAYDMGAFDSEGKLTQALKILFQQQ